MPTRVARLLVLIVLGLSWAVGITGADRSAAGHGALHTPQIDTRQLELAGVILGRTQADRGTLDDLVAAIVVDVDADGDIDIVAVSRDNAIVVLVNDGLGRFTREEPPAGTSMRAGPTWRVHAGAGLVAIVESTRSTRALRPAARSDLSAPPDLRLLTRPHTDASPEASAALRLTPPRAPPAAHS